MSEKSFRAVILGGDAAGMSAASQIKRRIKTAEVTVLEKGEDVSYGACGMPYNIGYRKNIDELVVMKAEDFRNKRGINVLLLNEAIGVDFHSKKVFVKDIAQNREYELPYDKLFIGTGARAALPPIKGIDQDGVFTLKVLNDARNIKAYLDKKNPKKAVLIGGGFINLELSENLKRLGADVVILEKLDDILLAYDEQVREMVKQELKKNDVSLITGANISSIEPNLTVITDKGEFASDFINVAAGVKPNTDFLENTQIELERSAIVVDKHFQTNIEDVYAGGDCATIYHKLLKRNIYLPLGTYANKAGKMAGANIAGANEEFPGVLSTTIFKVFDIGIAKTGLSLQEAKKEGYEAFNVAITAPVTAHGYPYQGKIMISLTAEHKTGTILGAQVVGDTKGVWRIDVLSCAISAQMNIKELQGLDLAYSPPFAPVWDPILVCANQAIKKV